MIKGDPKMAADEEIIGGGAGGGTGMDDSGNNLQSANATYQIAGNQVVLLSRKSLPPDKAGPSVITILAAGGLPTFADDGKVDVRGAKGVRITAGPPAIPMVSPPVTADTTNGVEIMVGETQYVTIHRGISALNQKIEMFPNGIMIDAGISGILQLKAGASSITISAEGITITGMPLVEINP
jgi:hypothetical protein